MTGISSINVAEGVENYPRRTCGEGVEVEKERERERWMGVESSHVEHGKGHTTMVTTTTNNPVSLNVIMIPS